MADETPQQAYVRRILYYRPVAFYQLDDPALGNGDQVLDETGAYPGVYVVHNDATHTAAIASVANVDSCNPPAGVAFSGSVDFSGGVPSGGIANGCASVPVPDLLPGDFTVFGCFWGADRPPGTAFFTGGCQGQHGSDLEYVDDGGFHHIATSVLTGGLIGNLDGSTDVFRGWGLSVAGGYYDKDDVIWDGSMWVPNPDPHPHPLDDCFHISFQVGNNPPLDLGIPPPPHGAATDAPRLRLIVLQRLGSEIRGVWDTDVTDDAFTWRRAPLATSPAPAGAGVFVGTLNYNRALSGYWGNQIATDSGMADWVLFDRVLSDQEVLELLECGKDHPLNPHVWCRWRGTVEKPEPAGVGGPGVHLDSIPGGDPR